MNWCNCEVFVDYLLFRGEFEQEILPSNLKYMFKTLCDSTFYAAYYHLLTSLSTSRKGDMKRPSVRPNAHILTEPLQSADKADQLFSRRLISCSRVKYQAHKVSFTFSRTEIKIFLYCFFFIRKLLINHKLQNGLIYYNFPPPKVRNITNITIPKHRNKNAKRKRKRPLENGKRGRPALSKDRSPPWIKLFAANSHTQTRSAAAANSKTEFHIYITLTNSWYTMTHAGECPGIQCTEAGGNYKHGRGRHSMGIWGSVRACYFPIGKCTAWMWYVIPI